MYDDVALALADYRDYEAQVARKYNLVDEDAYRAHIGRRYAKDPRYAQKLATAIVNTEPYFLTQ